jgi:hypothetical protein
MHMAVYNMPSIQCPSGWQENMRRLGPQCCQLGEPQVGSLSISSPRNRQHHHPLVATQKLLTMVVSHTRNCRAGSQQLSPLET